VKVAAMVNQVKVLAILMIVNGALSALTAIAVAALGPVLILASQNDRSMRADDKTAMAVFAVIFVASGLLVLVIGVLHLIAGIRCLSFRGRVLAIVALFSNLVVIITLGLCGLLSIALMIYGLIVLFNRDVMAAFAMGQRGHSPQEILAAFDPYRRRERFQDDSMDEDYSRARRAEPGLGQKFD
jgi:hypothetical protein